MIYQQKSHKGKVLLIATLLAVGAITYGIATTNSARADDPTDFGSGAAAIPPALTQAIQQINKIRLDNSIFNDTTFQSLQDYTTVLPNAVIGRANPFAPINVAPVQPVKTTKTTTTKTTVKH